MVLATSPDGGLPRPHRVDIGSFAMGEKGLDRVATTPVETAGVRTTLASPLPEADLHLLNDGDLTFAAVRTDEKSLRTMLASAGDLPDPMSRALAVATAWDMLVKGELATDDLLGCVIGVLGSERTPGVVEPFLALAQRAADLWTPTVAVPTQLARLADCAAALAGYAEHRAPALRVLAAAASDEEHFGLLADAAAHDNDLAWRVLARRAALGEHDPAAVEALLQRDADPEAWVRALGVTAARPDAAAKEEVWAEVFEKRSVPASSPLVLLAGLFWRPLQAELLVPFAHRYLDVAVSLSTGGMLARGGLLRAMFPTVGDQAFLDRARAIAGEDGQDPTVRATLLTGSDNLSRMLRARA